MKMTANSEDHPRLGVQQRLLAVASCYAPRIIKLSFLGHSSFQRCVACFNPGCHDGGGRHGHRVLVPSQPQGHVLEAS